MSFAILPPHLEDGPIKDIKYELVWSNTSLIHHSPRHTLSCYNFDLAHVLYIHVTEECSTEKPNLRVSQFCPPP